jgi:hypothetical protein
MRRDAIPICLFIVVATAAILLTMGRPAICTCGEVDLWTASTTSAKTSQMLTDWYSASHIVHGVLFYGLLWLAARSRPLEVRLSIALLIEAGWEVVENTPLIIDRYREATVALGYTGDSVLNSMSDLGMMALGFIAAGRLPPWLTLVAVAVLEITPLLMVRDNLTLNIWMLLAPNDAVRTWQGG